MDYIEKLERQAAAMRQKAQRSKYSLRNAANNKYRAFENKAEMLEDKARQFRELREENPARYAKIAKSQKSPISMRGFMLLLLLGAIIFISVAKIYDDSRAENAIADARADILNFGWDNLRKLEGQPTPKDKETEWGQPVELKGFSDSLWVEHYPRANILLVIEIRTDIVLAAGFGALADDVAELVRQAESKRFKESDAIILCGNYFDESALYEGSTYHSVVGRGRTQYDENMATLFVEATLVNGFGAKSKKVTSCTVETSYRLGRDGDRAFNYVSDFQVLE